ncbi:Arg83 zinc finger protein [Scheffersomyces xylosifermentans]|uniref:Arg83 zinc finger protein n=1 Tax=Scheffersomyces xylosifermentans TaxID=1304137 RepID=UPI00315D0DDA
MARKSRNFNGCWTCRARKVRCGLERPKCTRCVKAGRECAGYNIILGWSNPLTVDSDNSLISMNIEDENVDSFQRRNVELVRFPQSMVYETYKELNQNLERIENYTSENNGYKFRVGPFSVYKVDEYGTVLSKQTSQLSHGRVEKVQRNTNRNRNVNTNTNRNGELYQQHAIHPVIDRNSNSMGSNSQLSFFHRATSEPRTSHIRKDIHDKENTAVSNSVTILAEDEEVGSTPGSKHYDAANESIFSRTNNTWVHYELLDYAKLTILAIKGADYKFNEQNMLHILYPKFFPNTDSDNWLVDAETINKKLYVIEKGGNSESLRLMPLFNRLLNTFTSDIFSFNHVYYGKNYFDTIVIPYIKNIFCEFVCYDFTSWRSNDLHDHHLQFTVEELKQNIKLAIIHLVLALSAFKLSKENSKNVINDDNTYYVDDYLKLSIDLRKMAINIVNYHLDEYDSHSEMLEEIEQERASLEYEKLMLLALVLQVEIDNFFSVYENFELIFAIGDYIIKNKFNKVKLSNYSKLLVNVFKILYMFFESTQAVNLFNYSIAEGDEKINYGDLNENYDLASDMDEENDIDDTNDDDDDDKDNDKEGIQISPTVKNMVISKSEDRTDDYTPMSFTISFNKRQLTGYQEADDLHANDDHISNKKRQADVWVPHENWTDVVDINTVYLMYGYPKSLLDLFHETVHLTNHKNIFNRRKVFPRNFPRICAEIEDKIINWDASQAWKLDIEENDFHKCLYYNVKAMHETLMVYYSRLMKGNTPTNKLYNKLHANNALDYLQELINLSSKHLDFKIRPSFWILLVCGAEIDDTATQRKIEAMWQQNHQFNQQYQNYWRGKQLLYEAWKRGHIGEEYGFMDLIREWEIVLCLG